jgi:signal transduction histidine kinase
VADALREVARQEAERIATSKSQFLATMSHELRTPLNAIIGFSELLVQPGMVPPDDPRRDEYARIINGSGQHLLEVVNAILDMSKIESGMMMVEQECVEGPRVGVRKLKPGTRLFGQEAELIGPGDLHLVEPPADDPDHAGLRGPQDERAPRELAGGLGRVLGGACAGDPKHG